MSNIISRYWQRRRERFYWKNRWHLVLDYSLVIIILMLAAAVIGLLAYRPIFSSSLSGSYDANKLDLNNPPLVISFTLASSTAEASQPVLLKIDYQNNSPLAIQNLVISLSASDDNFSLSGLSLASGTPASARGQALVLPVLAPAQNGEVLATLTFTAKNPASRVINWQAQYDYGYNGQALSGKQIFNPINLSSTLSMTAVAYYNSPEGDQLGAGPLPPVVALPTNYWIFWQATSSGSYKNLVVSAKLPRGVELTPARSLLAGNLTYNAVNRQLVWQVPALDNQVDAYRAGFEIQLIPTKNQAGLILPLISGLKYYATDATNLTESTGTLPDLTTNLDFDRLNSGQGKVASQ